MKRRYFLAASAAATSSPAIAQAAGGLSVPGAVQAAIGRFAALPVTASCLVVCDAPDGNWQVAHDPDSVLFVGSAVKTFILAECLIAAEQGRLSENDQWTVDDTVRSASSPVLLHLSGTTPARSVLEAMITHSDNTATDIALAKAGPDRVRALIARAGLTHTAIPDSTRRLFSYIAGAAADVGWSGMQRIQGGWEPGPSRPPANDQQSMLSSSTELVRWYQQALRGQFFARPETLTEFKRIQSMADSIAQTVPAGLAAYGKGGSIDWARFHCFSMPGQMVVGAASVTFSFTINWTGPDDGVAPIFRDYRNAVADVLKAAADSLKR